MKQHGCSGASLHMTHVAHAHLRFSRLEDIDHILPFIASHVADAAALYQGLSELMINAIEHGNLGISYAEKTHLLHIGTWQQELERRLAMPANQSKYATLDYTQQDGAHILTSVTKARGSTGGPTCNSRLPVRATPMAAVSPSPPRWVGGMLNTKEVAIAWCVKCAPNEGHPLFPLPLSEGFHKNGDVHPP